jgi:hypothetical protein
MTNVMFVTPDQTGAGSCVSVAWARLTIKAASPVIWCTATAATAPSSCARA